MRVTRAVELLVMAARDGRQVLQLARPRDLLQELEGVHDVRFDLPAFAVVERSLGDREQPDLLFAEQVLALPGGVGVLLRGNFRELPAPPDSSAWAAASRRAIT